MILYRTYTDMAALRYVLSSVDSNSQTERKLFHICDRQMAAHRCAPSCGAPNCRYCRNISGIFCIHTKTWFASEPLSYAKVGHVYMEKSVRSRWNRFNNKTNYCFSPLTLLHRLQVYIDTTPFIGTSSYSSAILLARVV